MVNTKSAAETHNFSQKRIANIQWCFQCKCYIWSIQKGVVCTDCKLPCHTTCKSTITHECPKKPQTWKIKPNPQTRPSNPQSEGFIASLNKKGIKFAEMYRAKSLLYRNSKVQVHKAKCNRTNETVIAKTVPIVSRADSNLADYIQSLKEIQHPNLIPFHEAFIEKKNLIITSDQADGRAFFQPLCDRDYVTESDVSGLIKSVLEALEILHNNKIIHGMLRPEFIFVKDDDLSVKLSDFGLWKIVGPDIIRDTPCCKMYLAPELLQNQGFGAGIDMWCVGVITYYLLSGTPPFYGKSIEVITEGIIKADFDYPEDNGWDTISDNAIDFIDSLLVPRSSARMSVTQALNHQFIKNPSCTLLPDLPEKLRSMMCLYQQQIQAQNN